MKKWSIIAILIILFGAAYLTFNQLNGQPGPIESSNTQQQASTNPTGNSGNNNANSGSEQEEPYILPILGQSRELSATQIAAMEEWRNNVVKLAEQHPGTLFINGPKAARKVALTFDDGPDDICTPQILDILKQYQVTGNFFFKGHRVNKYQDVALRAAGKVI